MANPTTRVAVSLPEPLYRALEGARRRLGKSRSAVLQEALREWLRRGVQTDLVRAHVAGYLAQPERTRETASALATAIVLLGDADW
jgi:metal-responsive CopG/Arc/MetJ family transcriptional regulator